MIAVKFLAAFCLVLFINGNTVLGQSTEEGKTVNKIPNEVREIEADDLTTDQLAAKKPRNEKYRIGFQDTLEIQVFRHPQLSQVVNVSPDGTILLPRIDRPIIAVCKTERELADLIVTLYKDYLKNPFVNVRAVDQRSQPFAVIGAVEKPGSFYLNRRIRLLELLAFAGGPKVEKAGAKIQVARVGNISGCTENVEGQDKDNEVVFLAFRTNDVMEGKENPWMQPGDIVSVLEADEAYVVGKVLKPAKISLKEPKTLTQAIANAGGLDTTANTSKVTIQRQELGSNIRSELVFDLKDIRDKKISDPLLQANDIVEVSNDRGKAVKESLIKIISGGLGNIFYRIP